MSGPERFARMLRWYPAGWRARYGDEMVALLEDTHGMGHVPRRDRAAIAWAGSVERARAAGLLGDSVSPGERRRAGSLLVLAAWALFLVGGAIFAKFTDNWHPATPPGHQGLPGDALTTVGVAAVVGFVIVLAATLIVFPAFIRLGRDEGWSSVSRRLVPAAVMGVIAAVLIVVTLVWAQHLSSYNRNGGLGVYEAVFIICGVGIFAAIGAGTGAAVSTARRLTLPERTLRLLGALAVALTAVMVAIAAGTITWWGAMAAYAPRFLGAGIGNGIIGTSDTAPPTLVVAGVLMVIGLSVAALGTWRVIRSSRDPLAS
ncbi:MAG TPA: hypothetical protein VGL48_11140 [Acidimicrobiales bacterium]